MERKHGKKCVAVCTLNTAFPLPTKNGQAERTVQSVKQLLRAALYIQPYKGAIPVVDVAINNAPYCYSVPVILIWDTIHHYYLTYFVHSVVLTQFQPMKILIFPINFTRKFIRHFRS